MGRMILSVPIVIWFLFLLIRFRNLPEAFLAMGILWNVNIWGRSIILPLLKRQASPKQGSPVRSQVYAGVIATLALIIGVWLFQQFSVGPVLSEQLQGHTGQVNAIAFTSSADRFISAGEDKTIRLWMYDELRKAYIKKSQFPEDNRTRSGGSTEGIVQLVWGANSSSFVSLSRDGYIHIWNHDDGALRHELNWKANHVTAVAANPKTADEIAVGNISGVLGIWKLNQTQPREIAAHAGTLASLAYSGDGKLIATGGGDYIIRLWNSADGAPSGKEIKGHNGIVTLLAFSPDNHLLASASVEDHTVRIWKLNEPAPDGVKMLKLNQTTNEVTALAFGKDNKTLVTAGNDNLIRVWNAENGNLLTELIAHAQPVLGLGIADDGSIRAAGVIDSGKSIQLWRVGNLKEMRDMFSPFSRAYLLISTELTRLYWATVLGLIFSSLLVLFSVGLYSALASWKLPAKLTSLGFWQRTKLITQVEIGLTSVQVLNSVFEPLNSLSRRIGEIGLEGVMEVRPVSDFRVFLSYNAKDESHIKSINEYFKKRNLDAWFAREQITGGSLLLEDIQNAILRVKCAIIFVGTSGLGNWQERIEIPLISRRFVEGHLRPILVLLPGVHDTPKKIYWLGTTNWISFQWKIDESDPLEELATAVRKYS